VHILIRLLPYLQRNKKGTRPWAVSVPNLPGTELAAAQRPMLGQGMFLGGMAEGIIMVLMEAMGAAAAAVVSKSYFKV
jgi:hypothetical protein